jgi:MtN3 and saliva related transmembrane protein
MNRFIRPALAALFIGLFILSSCEGWAIHDTESLLIPHLQRSEIVGLVAGFGTTFAAVPDLIAMFRRRSTRGMNPRMAAIMGAFQIIWVYYGLLILSRPVVLWNLIAVATNFFSVGVYYSFAQREGK